MAGRRNMLRTMCPTQDSRERPPQHARPRHEKPGISAASSKVICNSHVLFSLTALFFSAGRNCGYSFPQEVQGDTPARIRRPVYRPCHRETPNTVKLDQPSAFRPEKGSISNTFFLAPGVRRNFLLSNLVSRSRSSRSQVPVAGKGNETRRRSDLGEACPKDCPPSWVLGWRSYGAVEVWPTRSSPAANIPAAWRWPASGARPDRSAAGPQNG